MISRGGLKPCMTWNAIGCYTRQYLNSPKNQIAPSDLKLELDYENQIAHLYPPEHELNVKEHMNFNHIWNTKQLNQLKTQAIGTSLPIGSSCTCLSLDVNPASYPRLLALLEPVRQTTLEASLPLVTTLFDEGLSKSLT